MSDNIIARNKIEIAIDGSGVDAGIAKIDRSIKGLGRSASDSGAQVSKGISKMGDGANEASSKIDASTKRISRSIENAIASAKAGSRGTAAFYESIANVRGANLDVLRPYINQLKEVETQAKQAAEANKKLSTVSTQSSSGINAMASSVRGLVGAYAGFSTITGIARMSDQFKLMNAQLKNSTSSQVEFNQAFKNVSAIAQSSQTDIADLAKVYARLSGSLKEFGTSQKDISDLTETLSLALKVNGATTEETTSALLQLSQAFGKGKLDGDEFKTVMEAAPNVMRELAKSLNVPFGALKDLAAQGGLTADVLLKAFTNPAFLASLRQQAEGMKTLSGNVVTTKNEFLLLAGSFDRMSGASTGVGKVFDYINTTVAGLRKTLEGGTWYERLLSIPTFGGASGIAKSVADYIKKPSSSTSGNSVSGKIVTQKTIDADKEAKRVKELDALYEKLGASAAKSGYNITLLSKDIAEQNNLQKDAKTLLDAGKISQSDYNAIIKKSQDAISSLNGESSKRKALSKDLKEQNKYESSMAIEQANANATLLKSSIALTQPNETIIEQTQRLIDSYSGASQSVKDYAMLQAQLATDDSLVKILDEESNARLDQVEAIKQQAIEMEVEVDNYGKLPSAIAEVTIARLNDKKAMLEGLGLVTEDIDAQIAAYERLRLAMVGKEFKDAEKQRAEAAKKTAEEMTKAYEKAADNINNSITDALLRGFESGKSFAKNFKDTLVNMFKTLILRPIVSFLVDSSGINKAIGAVTGSLGVTGTANASTGIAGGSIFDTISGGLKSLNTNVVGSIEKLGTFLSNGNGGLADTIGGYLGENASTIAGALSFAPAALSLLKGDIKGAAFQGAGAGIGLALGGPVGGAIGSFLGGALGGLFGGGDKSPRLVTSVSSNYSSGTFNAGNGVNSFNGSNGTASNQQALQEAFAKSLGMLFSGFGLSDSISTSSMLYKKRGTGAGFNASFDGGSVKTIEWSKSGDLNAIFQRLVDTVLGKTIVEAIQKSKLTDGIKSLFNGLTDKTQVSNMLTASLNLNSAQEQLAKRFGLTVDQAAKVSVATGLAGDSLSTFANNLASSASAFNTVGDVLVKAKAQLKANLGFDVPDSLNAFDAALKSIDKTTQAGIESFVEMFSLRDSFAAFTQTLDNLKGGVKGALYSIVSDTEKQAMLNADLSKAFGDLGLSVPTSIQDLITLGKSIDFTSKEGLDLASVFPSLVTAFNQTQTAVDGLMNSLRDINEFTTLVDFKRYKGLAANYGNTFANNYVDGLSSNVAASNSVNTPVATTIVPTSNNTTISTSDPNLLEAIKTLTAQVQALQASSDKTAAYAKNTSDVLTRVSPNGNALQTEAVV